MNVFHFRASIGRTFLLVTLPAALAGCAHFGATESANARFERLADEFVTTHFAERPLQGVALGWHQYDGQIVVPDRADLSAEEMRLRRFSEEFADLPADQLTAEHRHDLAVLQSAIATARWSREKQRVFETNPMAYVTGVGDAWGLDISIYLKRDFKPLPARIKDVTAILRRVPEIIAAAHANLEDVLPKPLVETAIETANGTADFIDADVAREAHTLSDPVILIEFEDAKEAAVGAIRSYAEWLETEKLPRANNAFALGRDNYIAMLKAEMIDLTPEQILEIGMKELHAEQERFARAAAVIDSTRTPVEVFKAMQHEHPTAAGLLPDTRKNLEAIRQFILDHHLVTIPSPVPARVEETLPPFRATSFASMDTPGPFEQKATEAYYYVTPVEPDWTPEQAEEWLSAFNFYALDVTSIHEAYPGHYVQFLALNASPVSTVAKVFGSYPFIEGWAHYAEQMMLEEGYGQPADPATATHEDIVRGAKFQLDQSDEALLRICRLCCSVKMHCQGMTVDEATRFFMDNCYYEEKPARSEAVRGTFDPGYLYYTLGKLMILKLRRDWRAQEGSDFSLQRFHDEFLRHGTPPIPLMRRIMLKDSTRWAEVL